VFGGRSHTCAHTADKFRRGRPVLQRIGPPVIRHDVTLHHPRSTWWPPARTTLYVPTTIDGSTSWGGLKKPNDHARQVAVQRPLIFLVSNVEVRNSTWRGTRLFYPEGTEASCRYFPEKAKQNVRKKTTLEKKTDPTPGREGRGGGVRQGTASGPLSGRFLKQGTAARRPTSAQKDPPHYFETLLGTPRKPPV